MTRLLSVAETKWHFYECAEAGDIENMCSYFETMYFHYKSRNKRKKRKRVYIAKIEGKDLREEER